MTDFSQDGENEAEKAQSGEGHELTIKLNEKNELDLSGLGETEIAELKRQYLTGMIDVKKKAEDLQVEIGALDAALGSFTDQTQRATNAGASATITHTQTSSLGRTEVVIGNTEKAASGKVSRSAAGEDNKTIMIVATIIIVLLSSPAADLETFPDAAFSVFPITTSVLPKEEV